MTHASRQAGMTMIETMVAMAISAVLVLGSVSVYTNARANYRTAENIARLQEGLRFATGTLDRDIRLASFWGMTNEGAKIFRDPTVRVTCAGDDVTDWALPQPTVAGIEARESAKELGCPGTNPRANSDVLIVRHASPQTAEPDGKKVQVFATSGDGRIFSSDAPPADIVPNNTEVHDVEVNAYYVSNTSKYDDKMPSLRRRSLDGTTMQDQEIITGVENLQVQFGIDRNGDGQVDGYFDANRPQVIGNEIVSVRLWLLVRGDTDESGQGYRDDNAYVTPDADGLIIVPDAGEAYSQNYRRYAFTKTIKLKN